VEEFIGLDKFAKVDVKEGFFGLKPLMDGEKYMTKDFAEHFLLFLII